MRDAVRAQLTEKLGAEKGTGKRSKTKRGSRECFIARPGYAIVSVDMDAFEMRTWAQCTSWLFGVKNCALVHILNDSKRCPHVEFGQLIWSTRDSRGNCYIDLTLEEAYELKGDWKAKLRGNAKGPNFGLPGGMSPPRLMGYCWTNYRVPMSIEVAELAWALWRDPMYPEAGPYLNWVKDQVGRKFGSRRQIEQFYSKRLRGDTGYTDAANGYFQALAADIAKLAGTRLRQAAYGDPNSPLYGCRPLAFVHDEWLYEVPLHRIHEAGHEMARIMIETAMEICPDVLFSASPAAMYRWSKAAGDPVYAKGVHYANSAAGPVLLQVEKDAKLCKAKDDGARLIVYEDSLALAA